MKKVIRHKDRWYRQNRGYSLVELLVVTGLLLIVLAIIGNNFITILSSSKGQAKIAETETETIIGLEILRQDIEHAGYGLPWYVSDTNDDGNFSNDWGSLNNYVEAASMNVCNSTHNINTYNDAPNNAPRAILSGNNVCSDGSDYLVIKSIAVRNHGEAQKWTYLWNDGAKVCLNCWQGNSCVTSLASCSASSENMEDTTQIVAIAPLKNKIERVLITYGTTSPYLFSSQLSNVFSSYSPLKEDVFFLFGVGSDASLRMPFNRADYYISRNNPPSRCANGTGVLEKATLNHADGRLGDYSPLLDCVADMQVVYGVDQSATPDGQIDCYTNDLSIALPLYNANNIRDRVKEVRVYILAHEGQFDRNYIFGSNTVRVGDSSGLIRCNPSGIDSVLGRDFNLAGITNFQNYRWKVYEFVILPDNLKGR